jgi:hypothetical protein
MNHLIIYNNTLDLTFIDSLNRQNIYSNIILLNNSNNSQLPIFNGESLSIYHYDIRSPITLFRLNQFYIGNLKSIGDVDVLINGGRSSYTLPQFYISRNFLNKRQIYYREMSLDDDLRVVIEDSNFDGNSHIFKKNVFSNLDDIYRIE